MSNPRIEEVSDSDPEIEDPSDFRPGEVFRPANLPSSSSSSSSKQPNPTLLSQPPPPQTQARPSGPSEAELRSKRAELKPYTTLYPIYFSSKRSRHSGRRVSKSLATPNPLAYNIFRAVYAVLSNPSIKVGFEPEKTHPKDWSNPGRVKVQLFDPETHEPLDPNIKNKQRLYNLVAEELKQNPITKESPLELKLHGLPVPENFLDTPPAVPRGWKMNEILPVHSAAVTGGGVSDNFLKEAMEEMKAMQGAGGGQGALPGGMDMGAMQQMMASMGGGGMGMGMGGGGGGKKKDKKK